MWAFDLAFYYRQYCYLISHENENGVCNFIKLTVQCLNVVLVLCVMSILLSTILLNCLLILPYFIFLSHFDAILNLFFYQMCHSKLSFIAFLNLLFSYISGQGENRVSILKLFYPSFKSVLKLFSVYCPRFFSYLAQFYSSLMSIIFRLFSFNLF